LAKVHHSPCKKLADCHTCQQLPDHQNCYKTYKCAALDLGAASAGIRFRELWLEPGNLHKLVQPTNCKVQVKWLTTLQFIAWLGNRTRRATFVRTGTRL